MVSVFVCEIGLGSVFWRATVALVVSSYRLVFHSLGFYGFSAFFCLIFGVLCCSKRMIFG